MAECSLCGGIGLTLYFADHREFWRCSICQLIQVPEAFHLSAAAELAHYQSHENSPDDRGYREFIDRLCRPLNELLPANSRGLDFGSGPGPTLSLLMEERGHDVANYDPYFAPDHSLLRRRYDFITLTEVVEHLQEPGAVLRRLWQQLNPKGLLAVMTQTADGVDDFDTWYYRRDPTHICFWHRTSFQWLVSQLPGAELIMPDQNLAFFRRA